MAGFFKHFANRVWRGEQHVKTLADTLQVLVDEMLERGEADKEMINIHLPLLQELQQGPFVEFSFFRRSVLKSNPDLARLFKGPWKDYLKQYNVAATIPQAGGAKRDAYFLAAWDEHWKTLDTTAIRKGVIPGTAVDFNEDLETAIARVMRTGR